MPPTNMKKGPSGSSSGPSGSPPPSTPSSPSSYGDKPSYKQPGAAKKSLGRVQGIRDKARIQTSAQHKQVMSELGFTDMDQLSSGNPYLIVATDGEERCGKTHFGCTAPGPIAYFAFDPNYRYVLPKFPRGKIVPNLFEVPKEQGPAVKEWERFVRAYYHVLHSGLYRSAVIDTFTDVYRLVRMAEFGKLKEIGNFSYDVVNAPLFGMCDDLAKPDSSVNWIFIHKMTDEYVKLKGQEKDVRTGKMVRSGWKHINYKVAVTLRHVRFENDPEDPDDCDPDGNVLPGATFGFKVVDCGPNAEITNQIFVGEEATFKQLAMHVYPDSGEEVWEDEFGS